MSQTIPTYEKWIIRYLMAPKLRRAPISQAQEKFIQHGKNILRICENFSEQQMRQRIQLPRIRGLEPVSMDWSIAMTIEHLMIVANGVASMIDQLIEGKIPTAPTLAAVKPRDIFTGAQARQNFEQLLTTWAYRFDMQKIIDAPDVTVGHPWFGPLDAGGWYKMLATHQALHERQIEILASAVLSEIGKQSQR